MGRCLLPSHVLLRSLEKMRIICLQSLKVVDLQPPQFVSHTPPFYPRVLCPTSFGVLCFEVDAQTEPFQGKRPAHVIRAVLDKGERPQIPEEVSASPDVVPLMNQYWRQDPSERPEGFQPVVQTLEDVVARVGDPRNHSVALIRSRDSC